MGASIALARHMLGEFSGGRIVIVTDGRFDGAAEIASAADVELVRIGKPLPNTAVTRLRVRRRIDRPTDCQVLVEVVNFSQRPAECRLELRKKDSPEGGVIASAKVSLPPESRHQEIFDIVDVGPEGVPGSLPGSLVARLMPDDAYPDDNRAVAEIPPVR